jgi:hypothetical protein
MAYDHGTIVLIPDVFKNGPPRPMLVLSNSNRPFQGKQYTLAVISSTERDSAVPLEEDDLVKGKLLKYPSYVNCWSLHEVEDGDIMRDVAKISTPKLREVADKAHEFLYPI